MEGYAEAVNLGPAWSKARIRQRRCWTDDLITLTLDADTEPFKAGQFFNLALELDGELVRRAYSAASAPGQPLEFYLTRVEQGMFTPRLFALADGDEVWVERRPQGFFTLNYIPAAKTAWFVATGTGLGPFIAMLRTEECWQKFERIVVVHGVRSVRHLSYQEELAERSREHEGRLTWVPVVSREASAEGVLHGRVTHVLASGELEARAEATLDTQSHVLLCGNPDMIQAMTEALKARGLSNHRVRKPGQISTEKYW